MSTPVTMTFELLINGTWHDISTYVYQRDGVHLTGGKPNEGSTSNPAQLTFTVNNRDGRFTPNYASGAYYPYLTQNVQLRLTVAYSAPGGQSYSGYRFWGQVSSWPPLSDSTGTDVYVQVTANGPVRQLGQGGGEGSAMDRYFATLSGSLYPVAYWPCEEDTGSNQIGAGLLTGQNMTIVSGTPRWRANGSFNGSSPMGLMNRSVWHGQTGSTGSAPSANILRNLVFVPASGGNNGRVLVQWKTSGTVRTLNLYYIKGGKLQLKGYNVSGTKVIDTGQLAASLDAANSIVSIELVNSGSNLSYALKVIRPGDKAVSHQVTGTLSTASCGLVTDCYAGPNGDITTTALGHFVVQYASSDIRVLSNPANGHATELSVDRFIRLASEQSLGVVVEYHEGSDHWGFETGTQSWAATNGALTTSTVWAQEGTHSLLLTCNGSGAPSASSPAGTSGQPVVSGDYVGSSVYVNTPAALSGSLFAALQWFNASGTALSTTSGTQVAPVAGDVIKLQVGGVAPSSAAFFAVQVKDTATETNGTLIYIDDAKVSTELGPQVAKRVRKHLEEVRDTEAAILTEARSVLGLRYRTRIALLNQTPAVSLSYTAGMLAGQLKPVIDEQRVANHIVVKRYKGSKCEVVSTSGTTSVNEPPNGIGRYKKTAQVVASKDEQLLALAQHLLALGTVTDERYPQITVDLVRSEVAAHVADIAGVAEGDYVQVTNLPFWFPSATAKQLVIGYSETITPFDWVITWNCQPESPYEVVSTSIRRW